jgi:predicted nucleic acid-binding protein
MSGRAFLDTNIFVYGYDERDPIKQSIADGLVRSLVIEGEAVISYQVIQEFFNIVMLKIPHKMPHGDAQQYLLTTFRPMHTVAPSHALISDAIRIQERYRLSWYDSLIVSAAQQAGCSILYSEDLQHGQQFGLVAVQNPFL